MPRVSDERLGMLSTAVALMSNDPGLDGKGGIDFRLTCDEMGDLLCSYRECERLRAQKAKDDAEHAALEADYAAAVRALRAFCDVSFAERWCEECEAGCDDTETIQHWKDCPRAAVEKVLLSPRALSVKEEGK